MQQDFGVERILFLFFLLSIVVPPVLRPVKIVLTLYGKTSNPIYTITVGQLATL